MNPFFDNYRGRYSQFWVRQFGLIPELPTHFDNAQSMYELVAWLQRAVKTLLDDFQALEMEMDDFKQAVIDLLEKLIPDLIRSYIHSKEFKDYLKDLLQTEEFKELLKKILKEIMNDPDMKEWFKDYLKEILKDPEMRDFFKEYTKEILNDLKNDPEFRDLIKELINDLIKDTDFYKDLMQQLKDLRDLLNNLTGQPDLNNPKAIYVSPAWTKTNEIHGRATISTSSYVVGDKRYIYYKPTLSFYTANRPIKAGEEIASVTYNQLKAAGMHQELIDGIRINHAVFLCVLDNGSNAVLELSKKEGYDEIKITTRFPIDVNRSILVHPEPRLYIMDANR